MTEKEQATLILAALNAALAPAVAYDYDKVPGAYGNAGTRPSQYAVIDITLKYGDKRRASGEVSVDGYRIGVRYVAKATNNARNMRALTLATLRDKILTADGAEVGPFVFESAEAIVPDDGYQSGSDVFTF